MATLKIPVVRAVAGLPFFYRIAGDRPDTVEGLPTGLKWRWDGSGVVIDGRPYDLGSFEVIFEYSDAQESFFIQVGREYG